MSLSRLLHSSFDSSIQTALYIDACHYSCLSVCTHFHTASWLASCLVLPKQQQQQMMLDVTCNLFSFMPAVFIVTTDLCYFSSVSETLALAESHYVSRSQTRCFSFVTHFSADQDNSFLYDFETQIELRNTATEWDLVTQGK